MSYINNNKLISLGGIKKAYIKDTLILQSFAKNEPPSDNLMKITATFNGYNEPTTILGSSYWFNYSQLHKITIDGVNYDFNTNGREAYLSEGVHTIVYYAYIDEITSMADLLQGCYNMIEVDLTEWDFSNITSIRSLFNGCNNLSSIIGLDSMKTSSCTDFGYMFYRCYGLTSLDLSSLDFSKATKMDYTFTYCDNLTEVTIISNINPNTDYSSMFYNIVTDGTFYYNIDYDYSKIIEKLPETWNAVPIYGEQSIMCTYDVVSTESSRLIDEDFDITTFNAMYVDDEEVELSATYQFSSIGEHTVKFVLDKAKVLTSLEYLFDGIGSLTSVDLRKIDTSNVTSFNRMFRNCYSLTTINGIETINTSSATNLKYMFLGCLSLTSLDLSQWDVSNVTNVDSLWSDCESLTSLNVSNWNLKSLTDFTNGFNGMVNLTNLNVTDMNVYNVTSMNSLFEGCHSLTEIIGLNTWFTPNLTSVEGMFKSCRALSSIDLSVFDFKNVSSFNFMFEECFALTSVKMYSNLSNDKMVTAMFGDVTSVGTFEYNPSFDYSEIIDALPETWNAVPLGEMFVLRTVHNVNGATDRILYPYFDDMPNIPFIVIDNTYTCAKGNQKYLPHNENTHIDYYILKDSLTTMYAMFYKTNLASIDLTNLNTSNVNSMSYAFGNCSYLTTVTGLETIDTSSCENLSHMFRYCTSLTSLNVSTWDTSKVIWFDSMFDGCELLSEIIGYQAFKTSSCIYMPAMFYNTRLTTYDLRGWDLSNVTTMSAIFNFCSNAEEIYMDSPLNAGLNGSDIIGYYTKSDGIFYYNPQYDYSPIISNIETYGWTAVPISTN